MKNRPRAPTLDELWRIRELRAAVAGDVMAGRLRALSLFREADRQHKAADRAARLKALDAQLKAAADSAPQGSFDDDEDSFTKRNAIW